MTSKQTVLGRVAQLAKANINALIDQAEDPQLVARAASARAQNRMTDAVRSVDVLDPASELGRFEDKVRREEARAQGKEELAASSLDAQFESLDALGDGAEIDARLARIKTGAA
jgi:phage shock protein A